MGKIKEFFVKIFGSLEAENQEMQTENQETKNQEANVPKEDGPSA